MPSSMPNGMSVDEIIETIKMFKSSSNVAMLPHVIGKAFVENFNAVLPMEDRPRCKLDYKSGEIIIVEIPTPAHEGAIESVRQQVVSMDGGLQGVGSSTYLTTTGSVIEPDGSWFKKDPLYELRVVLEVGYSQKLDALQQKAKKWLSETCCREVILIEISNNRELLRGEIWRRNRLDNPIQTEDFSNVASANTQFLYLDLKNIYDNAIWGIPQFFRDPQRFPGLRIPIDLYILRECLEEFTNKLMSTMSQLQNTEKKLEIDSERLVLRIENIHNNIAALKMTKFVDERIIDVPSEVLKKAENPHLHTQDDKSSHEEKTTNAIKIAVKQGLQLISDQFREVNLVGPDFFADVDPNFVPDPIFEAHQQYLDRKLPAIIGSQQFNASPTAGLFDFSSSTPSSSTNVTIRLPQNQPAESSHTPASVEVKQPHSALIDVGSTLTAAAHSHETSEVEEGPPTIKSLAIALENELDRVFAHMLHYNTINYEPLYIMATALDPNYAKVLEEVDVDRACISIASMLPSEVESEVRASIPQSGGGGLAFLLGSLSNRRRCTTPPVNANIRECLNYIQGLDYGPEKKVETIKWWMQMQESSQQVSSHVPSPSLLQPTKVIVPGQINSAQPIILGSSIEFTKPSAPIQIDTAQPKLQEFSKPEPARPLPKARTQVVAPQLQPVEQPVPPKQPQIEVKQKLPQPTKEPQPSAQPLNKPDKKQGLLFTSSSESEEDEMSKPVMKSFDANFSDRLAAAIKQGPVAMRSTRESDGLSKRPVSMSSVPAGKGGEAGDRGSVGNSLRASVPRTTNSSVSSNEELGPSSVASRISQIGDKIPIGGRTSAANKKPVEDEQSNVNQAKPVILNDTAKDRPKGPARRAPSTLRKPDSSTENATTDSGKPPLAVRTEEKQAVNTPKVSVKTSTQSEKDLMSSLKATIKPSTTGLAPTAVQPDFNKAKIKSIFDSSSSGDDELASSKSATTTKTTAKLPNTQAKPALFASTTTSGATKSVAKPKKSLFEDSDSE